MNRMIQRRKNLNNRKGFTLIELIVVIAILGILAAILIPQFGGFQDRARATQALTDAKQVATAIDALQAESIDGTYPDDVDVIENLAGGANGITGDIALVGTSGGFTVTVANPNGDDYVAGRPSAADPVRLHDESGYPSP